MDLNLKWIEASHGLDTRSDKRTTAGAGASQSRYNSVNAWQQEELYSYTVIQHKS